MTSIEISEKAKRSTLPESFLLKLHTTNQSYYNSLKKSQYNFIILRCKSLYKNLDSVISEYPNAGILRAEGQYDKHFFYSKIGILLGISISSIFFLYNKEKFSKFWNVGIWLGECLVGLFIVENYYYSQKLLPIMESSNLLLKSLIYESQSKNSFHMRNFYNFIELDNREKLIQKEIEKFSISDYKKSLDFKQSIIDFLIESSYAPVEESLENEIYFTSIDDSDSEDSNIVLNMLNYNFSLKTEPNLKTGVKSIIKNNLV